jgi:hypothetical protein
MRIRLLLLLSVPFILMWLAPLGMAQTEVPPTDAMAEGNRRYEAGYYLEAVDIYEAILAAGIENSNLYFNLGNAYFKSGDLGRAILNYRRAYYMDPRDRDIATNLSIARLQTVDRLDGGGTNGFENLVQLAEEWLTIREAALLALFLWLLFSTLLTVAILVRRFRKYLLWIASIIGVFLIIGLISMGNRIYIRSASPPAVVLAPSVDVTSGPGNAEQYVVEFTLHTGAEVSVVDTRPGWRRIALAGNSFQGWVPADTVESVFNE